MFALLFLGDGSHDWSRRRVKNGRSETSTQFSLPPQKVSRYQQRTGISRGPLPRPRSRARRRGQERKNAHSGPPTPPRENAEDCWPWKREQKLSGGALASSAAVAPARTARASLLEEEEKGRENRVTRWRMCSSYRGGGGRASELWGAKGGEGGCVCG